MECLLVISLVDCDKYFNYLFMIMTLDLNEYLEMKLEGNFTDVS